MISYYRMLQQGRGRSVEAGAFGDAQECQSATSILLSKLHPVGRVGKSGKRNYLEMRTWDLSQKAFFHLLERLDVNPTLAGEEYEKLRSKLIFFFDRKGCPIPNELCDETINRVAQKIGEGCEIPDLLKFSLGVARLVLLEYWNDPKKDWDQLDEQLAVPAIDREDFEEQRFECMKKCLQSLSSEDRDLIVKNCSLDKNGKLEMAATMGLTMNALRLRVFRIRAGLRVCCEKCIRARKEVASRSRAL